jgi:hypothetical protein
MQNVIAISIVALAVAYLMLRGWQFFAARSAKGCGSGCGNCPASEGNGRGPAVVSIAQLKSHGEKLGQ